MRRVLLVCVVAALIAGVAIPARASTRSELDVAERRFEVLQAQIETQQRRIDDMQARLRSLALQIATDASVVAQIDSRIRALRAERALQQRQHDRLRAQVGRIAANVYMTGTPDAIAAVIVPGTLTDMADANAYADVLANRTLGLAEVAQSVADSLAAKVETERELLVVQREQTADVAAAQRALAATFDEEQSRLATLARARREAAVVLGTLQERLRAEELAAARERIGRGTPLTFGEWAAVFLRAIDAPVVRNNLIVMVAWQAAEYTLARYNPLATTQPMPGATAFNGVGVRNYMSLEQGIQATIKTLSHPGYGYDAILASLRRGADAMETARAINASRWCYGCTRGRYVIGLIETVTEHYDRYAAS
jgi:hypothetical protein